MQAPTKEQLKERAKHLCEIMLEKYGVKVKHGHSLEVIARLFGAKDWNTASALSAEVKTEKPLANDVVDNPNNEKPIAAKLQKAGELADFFAKFDRETIVVVNEYHDTDPSKTNFGTVTSVCSLTYDQEIQQEDGLRLELNTEVEIHNYKFGKSASQIFEKTRTGRWQRRIKYLAMLNGFFNPRLNTKS